MKLDKFRNLEEVISKEEFTLLINELIVEEINYYNIELLEILDILSEKYLKFYEYNYLTDEHRSSIAKILIKLTDFSSLSNLEYLIGILFNFRINEYYFYLKKNCNTIISEQVRNEVLDSLKEYEET